MQLCVLPCIGLPILRITWGMHGIVIFNALFDLLPFLCFQCLLSLPPALPPLRLFELIELDARLLCLVFGPIKGLLSLSAQAPQ